MSKGLERYRVLVIALLGVLVVAGSARLWFGRPRPGPILISTPEPSPTPTPLRTATPAPLRVYVTGAVLRPDVYLLPAESIVKDAVTAAGGATEDADLERINLALQLCDQQQVHVPRHGEDPTPPAEAAPPVPVQPGGKVNINTASASDLDSLPGIGPAIAQRIVDYREAYGAFTAIDEITHVKGIGPATYEELKDLITVQ